MADRVDSYVGYNFVVELGGSSRAGFRECAELESSQNAVEYREGADRNLATRKIPGLNSYGEVTLSHGATTDAGLWEWRQKAMQGEVERRTIAITLLDDTGAPRIAWTLFECWPTKWMGPNLNATGDEIAIEHLVLEYERLEVTTLE
jgi:phage tail-like protein